MSIIQLHPTLQLTSSLSSGEEIKILDSCKEEYENEGSDQLPEVEEIGGKDYDHCYQAIRKRGQHY